MLHNDQLANGSYRPSWMGLSGQATGNVAPPPRSVESPLVTNAARPMSGRSADGFLVRLKQKSNESTLRTLLRVRFFCSSYPIWEMPRTEN